MDIAASREPVAGNAFDKYGSTSPVVRRLMSGFLGALDELWTLADPANVLDVGCGEGVITGTWGRRLGPSAVVGLDRADEDLAAHWAREPNATFVAGEAERLPFPDRSFDLVASIEMLEQVDEPDRIVAELVRCARAHVLLSVPREPIWRIGNVLSGRHLRALGNSPANRQHWSTRGFTRLVSRHAEVVAVRTPLPWTLVLART